MTTISNPPAFPVDFGKYGIEPTHGMSLRDYFAGQALAGAAGNKAVLGKPVSEIASVCFAVADAMLVERAKGDRK